MTPEQKFAELFNEMYQLCEEQGWGDPFSYARSREIHMAGTLGIEISKTLSGADGIDADGECEFKSTIADSIKASYGGISVFPTWEQQVSYLREEKICKYKNHYYSRYENGKIVELWVLDCNDVLDLILDKLQRKHDRIVSGKVQLKDPRLSAQIGMKQIHQFGKKII